MYTQQASLYADIYSPVIETFSLKFVYRKLHPARAPRPRRLYYIILRLFVALSLYLHISGRRGFKRFFFFFLFIKFSEDDTNSEYIYKKIELYNF